MSSRESFECVGSDLKRIAEIYPKREMATKVFLDFFFCFSFLFFFSVFLFHFFPNKFKPVNSLFYSLAPSSQVSVAAAQRLVSVLVEHDRVLARGAGLGLVAALFACHRQVKNPLHGQARALLTSALLLASALLHLDAGVVLNPPVNRVRRGSPF